MMSNYTCACGLGVEHNHPKEIKYMSREKIEGLLAEDAIEAYKQELIEKIEARKQVLSEDSKKTSKEYLGRKHTELLIAITNYNKAIDDVLAILKADK